MGTPVRGVTLKAQPIPTGGSSGESQGLLLLGELQKKEVGRREGVISVRCWMNRASIGLCAFTVVACGADGSVSPSPSGDRISDTPSLTATETREGGSAAAGPTVTGTPHVKPPTHQGRVILAPLDVGEGSSEVSATQARSTLEAQLIQACGGELCVDIVTRVVASDFPDHRCHLVAIAPTPGSDVMIDRGSTVILQIGGKDCPGTAEPSSVSPTSSPRPDDFSTPKASPPSASPAPTGLAPNDQPSR